MEYKIGSVIEKNGIHYEVKKEDEKNVACEGCAFFEERAVKCLDSLNSMGECSCINRSDKKDVIFVKLN